MCDYSLHSVASRPANVGDQLVATDFVQSMTRGFAAVGEPGAAVCLLLGTEGRSRMTSNTTAPSV